jgi:peptidoglycan/xylan/chitin deacetylase (PgdA/CDA1 family)
VPASEFSAVRTVQVSVTNPGTAPSASLPFYIINQGFVSLTFDDGYYSSYSKGVPILDAAGLKCTFYTITRLVGDTADGYVTQSQLQTLYKNGHEIGNHTRTHPALSTVSSTQLTSETTGAQQDLIGWGYNPSASGFVAGTGNNEPPYCQLLFQTARSWTTALASFRLIVYPRLTDRFFCNFSLQSYPCCL